VFRSYREFLVWGCSFTAVVFIPARTSFFALDLYLVCVTCLPDFSLTLLCVAPKGNKPFSDLCPVHWSCFDFSCSCASVVLGAGDLGSAVFPFWPPLCLACALGSTVSAHHFHFHPADLSSGVGLRFSTRVSVYCCVLDQVAAPVL
jgi:hypothetical protein